MNITDIASEDKKESGPSFDMGGGYKVHVPAPEQEKRIGIRVVDWTRLKRSVCGVKRPPAWISNTYSAFFGIAGSGILTIIPLWSAQGLPNWVIPAAIISTGFSAAGAVALLLIDSLLVKKQETDVNSVLNDMQDIESPFRHLL